VHPAALVRWEEYLLTGGTKAKAEVLSGAKEDVEGSSKGKRNGNTKTMVSDRQAIEAGGDYWYSDLGTQKEIRKVTKRISLG